MPYIIECSEWRLLQALGLWIVQKKSRFDAAATRPTSRSPIPAKPIAELLEVELRRVFLLKECPRNLSPTEFEEWEARLKSLCNLLDGLVSASPVDPLLPPRTDGLEYPRLLDLANRLETSDETFDLACGPHSTLFKLPQDQAELNQILASVTEYNDLLTPLLAPPAREAMPRPVKEETKKTWKYYRLRDRAAAVLGSLFKHIRCGTGHEVMLKLTDHLESGTRLPSLDIVMSLCPDLSQWQEIKCLINSRNPSNTAVCNICADLGQYTGQGKNLVLFIEEDGLFSAWAPSPSQTESPASPKDTLYELIIKGAFGPPDPNAILSGSDLTQYNPQEKRALAVRLGYCLMDFFDVNLSSKRIYLLGSSTVSFRNEPLYLSFKSGLPGEAESHIFRVGHPALLSFAKLLLEIDSGKIIHLDVSPQYGMANYATYGGLCDLVDQYEGRCDDSCLQAVRGCLMVHKQISTALRQGGMDGRDAEITIRRELYREVVHPLEIGLKESIPRAHHKRQRSESPEPASKRRGDLKTRGEAQVPSVDSYYTHRNAPSLPLAVGPSSIVQDSPAPKWYSKPILGEVESTTRTVVLPRSSGLFNDSTPAEHRPDLCKYADSFMNQHRATYGEVIKDTPTMPRIKVAVLDTGIDRNHPAVQANQERIKCVQSWLPEKTQEGDVCGHGTHVTTLLLDIAPDCDVYVAQIADKYPTSPSQIAKAVLHAVTDWKVDIITMSFGFTDESEQGCNELRAAILHAHASGILMFAAASNAGVHSPRLAFPARLSNVFCVYSGDGMGNSAPTNLTARSDAVNFLTLGEAVEGAGKTRKSGTSFATPIAAGIAAFLLLYADQNLPLDEAKRFREHDMMKGWLLLLSSKRGGYNVISVGKFFERSAEARRGDLVDLLDMKKKKK